MWKTPLHAWVFVAATCSAALACPGCKSRPGIPLVVQQMSPLPGEVTRDQLSEGIRFVFDREAAPEELVGRVVTTPAIKIEPPIAGTVRWINARTLAFFPHKAPQSSRAYVVTLDEAIRLRHNVLPPKSAELRFVFERIALNEVAFPEGRLDQQSASPRIALSFSQAVDPNLVRKACAIYERNDDDSLGAKHAVRTFSQTASEHIDVVAEKPLQDATGFVFHCAAGLAATAEAQGTSKGHQTFFATKGEAAIKGVSPDGYDEPPDGVEISIEFATPMAPEQLRQKVRLLSRRAWNQEPEPIATFDPAPDASRKRYAWKGDLAPNTLYEVRVLRGLQDTAGRVIGGDYSHSFRTGRAGPRLLLERGNFALPLFAPQYPLRSRDVAQLKLTCANVGPDKLAQVLTGPGAYDAWWDAAVDKPIDYKKLGLSPTQKSVGVTAEAHTWQQTDLDIPQLCGGGAGAYLLEVRGVGTDGREAEQEMHSARVLLSVTNLGLMAKVGGASSLVWVVDFKTGRAVVGAHVEIRDTKGALKFRGVTSADGTMMAPGAAKLTANNETADGSESEGDGQWAWRSRQVFVTATTPTDSAVLDTNWNNGVQIWNFQLPTDQSASQIRARGFIQSDRGLYRPGDTVHLKGLVRTVDGAGNMQVPAARKVHVTIKDPRAHDLFDADVQVSPFGGFWLDQIVEDGAVTGDYWVTAKWTDKGSAPQQWSERFTVSEYRARTFEVLLSGPTGVVHTGDAMKFTVNAKYLYGAPVRQGTLRWQVRKRAFHPVLAGFEHYATEDWVKASDNGEWWSRWEERSQTSILADGELALGENGVVNFETAEPAESTTGSSITYVTTADVTDGTGQSANAATTVVAHQSDIYLGLHPSEWVQSANMPFGIQMVAFDPTGKRRATRAELVITRRSYDCHTYPCARTEDEAAITRTLEIGATGSANVENVTLTKPGQYALRLSANNGRGGTISVSEMVYLVGDGQAFWSGDEGARMAIVASKRSYRPGDTARFVPQAQLSSALALVTVERDGILTHFTRQLASPGASLDVPVLTRFGPNAFVGVALVSGHDATKGRPEVKVGYAALNVDDPSTHLSVTVAPDRESYEPGQPVTALVSVVGADGHPVRAEVSVAAADEGVLQLIGYKTPNPWDQMYAPWGLGIETSTTWNRFPRLLDMSDDQEGGDAGEGGKVRSRFMATAFWAPAVVTGADGRAKVTFAAPDSLTAFRLMAVAADNTRRFGGGEKRFTVAKPLQAMPALPRFFVQGDQSEPSVLVTNNTSSALNATVTVSATGALLRSQDGNGALSPIHLTLPPGAQLPARFGLIVDAASQAVKVRATVKAEGSSLGDAVDVDVPVLRPVTKDVLVLAEGHTDPSSKGSVRFKVKLPPEAISGAGGLDVRMDDLGLSRLDESARYLVGYPYGCLEQTMSKTVAMAALGDLLRSEDGGAVPFAETANIKTYVSAGIRKLGKFQNADGGFGLWENNTSDRYYTAYALWAAQQLSQAGYPINQDLVAQAQSFLTNRLSEQPSTQGAHAEISSQALELMVLAQGRDAGQLIAKTPGFAALLRAALEAQNSISVEARAYVALALHHMHRDAEAQTILRSLTDGFSNTTGPIVIDEPEDRPWYWQSDVRSTALVLTAMLEISPNNPLLPRLVDGLFSRQEFGRWYTTQDNVASLTAISAYARKMKAPAATKGRILLRGQERKSGPLHGGVSAFIPLAELQGDPELVMESGGSGAYYSARLHVEKKVQSRASANQLSIERDFLDPESGALIKAFRVGQTVKVRLSVKADRKFSHVAVEDHLPAGFEPIAQTLERRTGFERDSEGSDASRSWWQYEESLWDHQDLRDDKAQFFASVLQSGYNERTYLVRVTGAGRYLAMPPTVEAMYDPARRGHGALGTITISK